MPKLSKRKRQLKEIHQRRSEEGGDNENSDENEEEEPEEPKPVIANGRGTRGAKASAAAAASAASAAPASTEPVWVQCNTCDKWRSLPCTVDPNTLPDIWTCDLNVYDPERANCEVPEENYNKEEDVNAPQKQLLRLWLKKLRCADRAENRLVQGARGKKKKTEVEWIRCCNPACGKWRALTRNIDAAVLLSKMHKNKHFYESEVWYCSMNSWDETTASCSAPQEPLWNCRWNING